MLTKLNIKSRSRVSLNKEIQRERCDLLNTIFTGLNDYSLLPPQSLTNTIAIWVDITLLKCLGVQKLYNVKHFMPTSSYISYLVSIPQYSEQTYRIFMNLCSHVQLGCRFHMLLFQD